MRSHALCSTGIRKEQWKPEQIGEIQCHTDRKERHMNMQAFTGREGVNVLVAWRGGLRRRW